MNQTEYFRRTTRLKPLIEADAGIMGRIGRTFNYVFKYMSVPSDVTLLNYGTRHVVVGVGTINDPKSDDEFFLALKLRYKPFPYGFSPILAEQIGAYETAFEHGVDPPYFIGAVRAEIAGEIHGGMIMEDVSKGKRLKLCEELGNEFCLVHLENGSEERRFIDPAWPNTSDKKRGLKYLEDIARISVPDLNI